MVKMVASNYYINRIAITITIRPNKDMLSNFLINSITCLANFESFWFEIKVSERKKENKGGGGG